MRNREILIRVTLPAVRRRLLLAGIGALLCVSAVAYAAIVDFNTSETLSKTKLNANFHDLDNRLSYINNAKSYSINAKYCGRYPAATGVDVSTVGGYAGAKAQCETVCSAPSAHLCTGDELVRFAATGGTTPSGWYAAGAFAIDSSNAVNDCDGFTSKASNREGCVWGGFPGTVVCSNTSLPILCCN